MTSADNTAAREAFVLFSYGFRPFFLFGALWAALAMILWITMFMGLVELPTRFDPVSWHAHEFLFGYLSAIIAGFLLTAVPNWTGRAPLAGRPLAALFILWTLGRVAIAVSALVPMGIPETIDLLFPVALGAVILREIVAGKNWRNLVVLALLGVFTLANLLYHLESSGDGSAAQGVGLRLGVASILMMISLIGGRIVPTFTRNWMLKTAQLELPALPMQRFDKVTLLVTLVALALWVIQPYAAQSGVALIIMGLLHGVRLVRWKGHHTLSEPLLAVLHVGYLFVPLGAIIEGCAILKPDLLGSGTVQHLWMAGGFALMTLGVMTRATLGHTGRDVSGRRGDVLMFMCVIGAVLARLGAAIWQDVAMMLYGVSAVLWIGAFAGFVFLYGRSLIIGNAASS